MNHGGGNAGSVALAAKVNAITLTAAIPTLSDVAGGNGPFTLASLVVAGAGSGYAANDVLTVTGGTSTTASTITVNTVVADSFHVNVPTLVAAGTGYTAADVLTISGGTSTTAATVIVDTVDGLGAILTYHLGVAGTYSVKPTDPEAVTGGTGNNDATFNLTWTLDPASGGILTASVTNAGSYSVKPANPVSVSGGGGSGATFTLTFTTSSTTFYARVTLVFPFGEQIASSEANVSVANDRKLRIASPATNTYATGYNVYVSSTAGTETRQASNIALGTNWTMPVSGLVSGAALPTTITLDANVAQNYTAILADNVTLANPLNLAAGLELRLWLVQDSTGSRVLTYGTQWEAAGGVTTIALTTTGNAKDLVSGIADTTSSITARIQKAVAH